MITVSASESNSESETRSMTGTRLAVSGLSKVACERCSIAVFKSGARFWDSGGISDSIWDDPKKAAMDSTNCLATFSLTRLPARDLRLHLQMIGGGIVRALREEVFLLVPSIKLQIIQRRYEERWSEGLWTSLVAQKFWAWNPLNFLPARSAGLQEERRAPQVFGSLSWNSWGSKIGLESLMLFY